jgi:hypothetical protein
MHAPSVASSFACSLFYGSCSSFGGDRIWFCRQATTTMRHTILNGGVVVQSSTQVERRTGHQLSPGSNIFATIWVNNYSKIMLIYERQGIFLRFLLGEYAENNS